ncbi:MAG: S41 family peptidase [Proteobacteria bacterium]|nr:S41 family peptidase [Pseudomonadota bacterium]
MTVFGWRLRLQLKEVINLIYQALFCCCCTFMMIWPAFASQHSIGTIVPSTVSDLGVSSPAISCDVLYKTIKFARDYHVANSTSAQRSSDYESKLIHTMHNNFDPLGVFLTQLELAQIERRVTDWLKNLDTHSDCSFVEDVRDAYMSGVKRYLSFVNGLGEYDISRHELYQSDSIANIFANREQKKAPLNLSELFSRMREVVFYENFYLSQFKSNEFPVVNHFSWIKTNYGFHGFQEYARHLFSRERIYSVLINSYLTNLDRYSSFLSMSQYVQSKRYRYIRAGSSEGSIGVSADEPFEFVTILEILANGSADKDGRLQVGDKIIAVFDEQSDSYISTFALPFLDMRVLLKGSVDSEFDAFVVRILAADNQSVALKNAEQGNFNMLCDRIAIPRAQAPPNNDHKITTKIFTLESTSDRLSTRIGWLRPNYFYQLSDPQSRRVVRSVTIDSARELTQMKGQGIKALVLDLRGNTGGHFVEMASMHQLFSDEAYPWKIHGSLNTRELNRYLEQAAKIPTVYDGPMVILVDANTASAAENLAHSLRILGRSVIVGEFHTVGKNLIQSMINLDPARRLGAILLSTHSIHTSSGYTLSERGLMSDILLDAYQPDKAKTESIASRSGSYYPSTHLDNIIHELRTSFERDRRVRRDDRISVNAGGQGNFSSIAHYYYGAKKINFNDICSVSLSDDLLANAKLSHHDQVLQDALEIAGHLSQLVFR